MQRVADRYEQMWCELRDLKATVARLEEDLAYYREQDDFIGELLVSARVEADEIRAKARAEAEATVRKARRQAERLTPEPEVQLNGTVENGETPEPIEADSPPAPAEPSPAAAPEASPAAEVAAAFRRIARAVKHSRPT